MATNRRTWPGRIERTIHGGAYKLSAVYAPLRSPGILCTRMTAAAPPKPATWLVPIAGPTIEPIGLAHKPGGVTLGRHDQCDICLPADAEKVSRMHARFSFNEGRWSVSDLTSRWGTFLNGLRLTAGQEMPLNDGDLHPHHAVDVRRLARPRCGAGCSRATTPGRQWFEPFQSMDRGRWRTPCWRCCWRAPRRFMRRRMKSSLRKW